MKLDMLVGRHTGSC